MFVARNIPGKCEFKIKYHVYVFLLKTLGLVIEKAFIFLDLKKKFCIKSVALKSKGYSIFIIQIIGMACAFNRGRKD